MRPGRLTDLMHHDLLHLLPACAWGLLTWWLLIEHMGASGDSYGVWMMSLFVSHNYLWYEHSIPFPVPFQISFPLIKRWLPHRVCLDNIITSHSTGTGGAKIAP